MADQGRNNGHDSTSFSNVDRSPYIDDQLQSSVLEASSATGELAMETSDRNDGDAASGIENADESSGETVDGARTGGVKRKRVLSGECVCVCSKCGRSMSVAESNTEEKEDEGAPQEPLLCGVCFDSFGPSLAPYSSRCGHLYCKTCVNNLQKHAKSSTGDSRYFKCPQCRASRQASDFFRLNMDSYTTTSDGRWINLRMKAREHKEVIANSTKQLKALIEAEATFLKGLPKTLSSAVIGKATIGKNRVNICEQFASSDRKVKLEAVLHDLEKVEVSLAMAGASLHKLEVDAKYAESVEAAIKRACEKEEAKRARLDERLTQAQAQRRRAQRELRDFETSNATPLDLGSQTPSQNERSGEGSTFPSSPHLSLMRNAIERITGESLQSDYDIVWLDSSAPDNISQIIRARLSADGQPASRGGGVGGGREGRGDEGGGGGEGGGSSV